jgi:hypothetical protein
VDVHLTVPSRDRGLPDEGEPDQLSRRRASRAKRGEGQRPHRTEPPAALGVMAAMIGALALFAASSARAVQVSVTSDPGWWTYVPAAVSACAAIAAFVVSVTILLQGRDSVLREQASRIFVERRQEHQPDGSVDVVATVRNESDVPIWEVSVRARRLGRVWSGSAPQTHPDIAPHSHHEWRWRIDTDDLQNHERHPRVSFIDNADRRWVRVGRELRLRPRYRRWLRRRWGADAWES